jgi:hypothetical protein
MAMVFPTSPTVGQVFTSGGRSWVWNGSAWDSPARDNPTIQGLVQVFANASARATAIPSPTEGMTTYLEDLDVLSIYETGAWRTSLSPRGGILQVVQGQRTGLVQTTSASFVDTLLTATITPKSSSSKILVIVSQPYNLVSTANQSLGEFALFRNSTNIQQTTLEIIAGLGAFNLLVNNSIVSFSVLDSPATTASTTYKTQFRNVVGSRVEAQAANSPSTITLMEVSF